MTTSRQCSEDPPDPPLGPDPPPNPDPPDPPLGPNLPPNPDPPDPPLGPDPPPNPDPPDPPLGPDPPPNPNPLLNPNPPGRILGMTPRTAQKILPPEPAADSPGKGTAGQKVKTIEGRYTCYMAPCANCGNPFPSHLARDCKEDRGVNVGLRLLWCNMTHRE